MAEHGWNQDKLVTGLNVADDTNGINGSHVKEQVAVERPEELCPAWSQHKHRKKGERGMELTLQRWGKFQQVIGGMVVVELGRRMLRRRAEKTVRPGRHGRWGEFSCFLAISG